MHVAETAESMPCTRDAARSLPGATFGRPHRSPMPTDSTADAPAGLLRQLRDALRGTERDYTAGPIGTALLLLAVPMVRPSG
jgi:hypothetical protein